jgi:hypothetical protein
MGLILVCREPYRKSLIGEIGRNIVDGARDRLHFSLDPTVAEARPAWWLYHTSGPRRECRAAKRVAVACLIV